MKKTMILSACLLLFIGLASFAQDVEPMINAGTNNIDNYLAEKDNIGLSKDQLAKLKEIKNSLNTKNAGLIKQRTSIIGEIRTMMSADKVDYAQVESKLPELEKVRSQIMMNRLSSSKDAENVLTNGQREKLRSLRAQRNEKMKNLMKERIEKMKSLKKGPAK